AEMNKAERHGNGPPKRTRWRTWGLLGCLIPVLLVIVDLGRPGEEPAAPPARKVFTNSVIPLPESTTGPVAGRIVAKPTAATAEQKVRFTITLSIPEKARKELADRISQGEVLTAKEIDQKYSPPVEEVKKLVAWLKAPEQGLQVLGQAKDRSGIYVS